MAHFAKLDSNNKVIHISVVDNENLLDENGIESEQVGIQYLTNIHGYSNWKQTSYNGNFRGTYAGIGDFYNPELDIFIQEKPFPTWVLNKELAKWEPPIPRPEGETLYIWSEETQSWIEDKFEQMIMEEIKTIEENKPSPEDLIQNN